jgi:hypothetical protein
MGRYAPKQADLNKTCHHFADEPEVDFGARCSISVEVDL